MRRLIPFFGVLALLIASVAPAQVLDIPITGDYDGDGKPDMAIFRPSDGTWFILLSSTNYTTSIAKAWGTSGDIPLSGDFDGDGKTDLAIYRPSTGMWYVLLSSANYTTSLVRAWGT